MKLNCNKKYYFIIFISSNSFVPIDFKIFIIDEIKNDIYINPSLSTDFNFFQTSDKPMKLNYKYNETKLSLIRLFGKMKLMIYENNMVLYNHSIKEEYKVLKFKFKKDIEYNITFEDISYNKESTIYFKFFDENKYNTYIKHNFIKSSLYLFNNYEYFIEIDLSKYKLGENFILLIFSNDENNYTLKYQYMNRYENNNLINIGTSRISSYNFNYINLKKNEDSNLILCIKVLAKVKNNYYKSINILKYKVEEINSDNKLEIKEPKVFYLDYYNFNKYYSFGISSNRNFLLLEQRIDDAYEVIFSGMQNLKIIIKDLFMIYYKRSALIFFDDKTNLNSSIILEFKKFDFPILCKKEYYSSFWKFNQYLQLGQDNIDNNEFQKDYYFYVNLNDKRHNRNFIDVFLPIIGNYNTYFIKETDIKKLSDLDFNKKKLNDNYTANINSGYLKIETNNNYSIFQHLIFNSDDSYYSKTILDTGFEYNFLISNLGRSEYITLNKKLINKKISLKFRIIGLNPNESIIMNFAGKEYILNDTSLEINYEYKNHNSKLIFFSGEKITLITYVEIKVAFLQEDLNLFKQIDFKDSIGKLSYNEYKGALIKIPKDFNEDLSGYFLIIQDDETYLQIIYDTIEFAVPLKDYKYKVTYPIIELFRENPYTKELNETNKYFFILISGGKEIIIKKSKIYDGNIEFNKLNIIPKLTGEDKKFYYKIKVPNNDFNFFQIQNNNDNYSNYISYNKYIFHKMNKIYYETFYNPYKNDNTQSLLINCFNTENNNYINIVPQNDYLLYFKNNEIKIYHNITQIEGSNKIKINGTSLSYYNYPKKYKYYLFINIILDYYTIFQIISGDKEPDASKKEKLINFEDFNNNESFEYTTEIDMELNSNSINDDFIVPVNIEDNFIEFVELTRIILHLFI